MCGIAGFVHRHAEYGNKTLRDMMSTLSHRGPDGEGSWVSKNQECHLGHKRLAIIDIHGGSQPLTAKHGNAWISFNGCIYNYLELKSELISLGHEFATTSDTEVVLVAFQQWREGCVEKFNGMFAFAIWEEETKQLFCARDRLGIKPFYFTQCNSGFAFASEIKALLSLPDVNPELNQASLEDYLILQAPLTNDTMFSGIQKLEPGTWIKVDRHGSITRTHRFWELKYTPTKNHSTESEIEELKELLADAVRLRMRADVPVGTQLSGGLDSSFITISASKHTSSTLLQSFSGAFDGQAYDETSYAQLAAREANIDLHIIRPSPSDFENHLSKIIYHMDEPTAGPGIFPQYMVSKAASSRVKVILGGQGGDEIFAGYTRYLACYLEECLKGAIEETSDSGDFATTLSTIIPNLPALKQYTPLLRQFWSEGLFGEHGDRYFHMLNRSGQLQSVYNDDVIKPENVHKRFINVFNKTDAISFLDKILNFDTKVQLQSLLHVEDRMSMAWGLESRLPLLDHRLVEFMAKIPVVRKFKAGEAKVMFKKACRGSVPDKIIDRQDKMGFPVPIQDWFKSDLKDFICDNLLSVKAQHRGIWDTKTLEKVLFKEERFDRSVWGLLNLELWHQIHIDR